MSAPILPQGGGEEILVVDDEETIRQLADEVLTLYGYHVITARDGTEAIHRFQRARSKIQLVLTDIMMPGLNGWDTIRTIREINPDVKVIACSGLISHTALAGQFTQKINAVLAKPYSVSLLLETVQSVLQTKTS